MQGLITLAGRFLHEDDGLETVEYAVMTALIVATIVAALGLLGDAMSSRFGSTQSVVESV